MKQRNQGRSGAGNDQKAWTWSGSLGCLLGWLALLALAAGVGVFFLAAVQLILTLAGRGDEASLFPLVPAIGITIGVPAVIDLAVRLAGRRRISASLPVANYEELGRDAASFGTMRVPPGLQELSFVPMLLLIPVLVVGLGDTDGWGAVMGVLVGIVIAVPPMFCGLFGGPHLVLLGNAAWLFWAWLTVERHFQASVVSGATLGAALWVMLYLYFARATARKIGNNSAA